METEAERAAKRQHIAPVARGRAAPLPPSKPQGRGRPPSSGGPAAPGQAPKLPVKAERRSQHLGRNLQSKAARAEAAAARSSRNEQGSVRSTAGNSAPLMRGLNVESEDTFAGTFARDLPSMMYGFGDDEVPLKETVDMVEACLLQYISTVAHRAVSISQSSLKNKMDEKDIMFVVRKDPAKFARIRELLVAKEMIAEVRKTTKEPAQ